MAHNYAYIINKHQYRCLCNQQYWNDIFM